MKERREELVDTDFETPVGSLEMAVAGILAEVLEVDRYGRADSFYDFGGTSLHAIRICARIESELGYRAVPVWLFETDVLADFAELLIAEGVRAGE